MKIVEVDKLSMSKAGLHAAWKASMPMLDAGWCHYPPPTWNLPAILAFEVERCVGGINWKLDDEDLTVNLQFAWCDPEYPRALTLLLLRFRSILKKTAFTKVHFTAHLGNDPMMKVVDVFGLRPKSFNYTVERSNAAFRDKP